MPQNKIQKEIFPVKCGRPASSKQTFIFLDYTLNFLKLPQSLMLYFYIQSSYTWNMLACTERGVFPYTEEAQKMFRYIIDSIKVY